MAPARGSSEPYLLACQTAHNRFSTLTKMEPNPEIVQQAMWNRNKQVFGALEKALGLLKPEGQVECTELEGAIQSLKELEINSEYGKMIQGIAFLGVARNREWQSQRSRERGRSIPRAGAQKERNNGIEGHPQERCEVGPRELDAMGWSVYRPLRVN